MRRRAPPGRFSQSSGVPTPAWSKWRSATAAAGLALYVEQRAAQDGDSVGTVGLLEVPNGSINVVPGRCLFFARPARRWMILSLLVATLSLGTGRTTVLQGMVHLVIFAVYLFTTVVP